MSKSGPGSDRRGKSRREGRDRKEGKRKKTRRNEAEEVRIYDERRNPRTACGKGARAVHSLVGQTGVAWSLGMIMTKAWAILLNPFFSTLSLCHTSRHTRAPLLANRVGRRFHVPLFSPPLFLPLLSCRGRIDLRGTTPFPTTHKPMRPLYTWSRARCCDPAIDVFVLPRLLTALCLCALLFLELARVGGGSDCAVGDVGVALQAPRAYLLRLINCRSIRGVSSFAPPCHASLGRSLVQEWICQSVFFSSWSLSLRWMPSPTRTTRCIHHVT